jgi:hypothetical protein
MTYSQFFRVGESAVFFQRASLCFAKEAVTALTMRDVVQGKHFTPLLG